MNEYYNSTYNTRIQQKMCMLYVICYMLYVIYELYAIYGRSSGGQAGGQYCPKLLAGGKGYRDDYFIAKALLKIIIYRVDIILTIHTNYYTLIASNNSSCRLFLFHNIYLSIIPSVSIKQVNIIT